MTPDQKSVIPSLLGKRRILEMLIFEIIVSSLSAIAGITALLDRQQVAANQQIIDSLVFALQQDLARRTMTSRNEQRLLVSYDALLEALRENEAYNSHLEFRRTEHNTWLLVRKRKTLILRDPEGEYAGPPEKLVEVDEKGNPTSIGAASPQQEKPTHTPSSIYPAASRCKDQISIREQLTLNTILNILSQSRPPSPLRWLDMCCGKGAILREIKTVINASSCSALEYYGIDVHSANIGECQKLIAREKLRDHLRVAEAEPHDASKPLLHLWDSRKFDVVTLLNVLHEIPPYKVYSVLRNAVDRCKHSGVIIIVDMCSLPHFEWQAITWTREHLEHLIQPILRSPHTPKVGKNPVHVGVYPKTVDVFSLTLPKSIIDTNRLGVGKRTTGSGKLGRTIDTFLSNKKRELTNELKGVYGSVSVDLLSDQEREPSALDLRQQKLLMEYFAVSEALSSSARMK
jgi:2-polyprenyl-3-methyl-5-hydroxy-6-metoxy-1,4-benzoquinol methylase